MDSWAKPESRRNAAGALCTNPSTARDAPGTLVSRGTTLGITRRCATARSRQRGPEAIEGELPRLRKAHKFATRHPAENLATSAKLPCLQRLRSGRQVYPGRYGETGKQQWKRLWISRRYRRDKRCQNRPPLRKTSWSRSGRTVEISPSSSRGTSHPVKSPTAP